MKDSPQTCLPAGRDAKNAPQTGKRRGQARTRRGTEVKGKRRKREINHGERRKNKTGTDTILLISACPLFLTEL